VKWQHLPELENKVTLQGEGIVTESRSRFGKITPFQYTYKRKNKVAK